MLPAILSIFSIHRSAVLENQLDDVLDPALQISQQLFRETLQKTIENKHTRFMVGLFLKKLKMADCRFKYKTDDIN